MTVGVAIPVLNGAVEMARLLPLLLTEPHLDAILIILSGSRDSSVDVISSYPKVRHLTIRRDEFNHGATRELARRALGTDIIVLLTQDVIPEPGFLGALVEPLRSGEAAVSYSRQLPHHGADIFEAAPREFNYPAVGNLRGLADTSIYGVYVFFCSDSCAAYVNQALDEIGGFEATLTNEDYFAVAKLLRAGHRIKYVAESRVLHSHRYTLLQEFQRYFDTGYVRSENDWVNRLAGQAEGRGARFASYLLNRLLREGPWLIPYAIIQTAVKWIGFRTGYWSQRLNMPRFWCRALSAQGYFWNSCYFERNAHKPERP